MGRISDKVKEAEMAVEEPILEFLEEHTNEAGHTEPPKKKKPRKRHRLYKHIDVNNGEKSFAAGLSIYKVFWVFIIGCVIGVVFETVVVFLTTGVLMRRSGMLYGPFNQIYGMGAVLFTVCLYRYRNRNSFVIFLASAILGLIFEFACSWVQEIAFGSSSWNYSEMALNIGGRTNLLYGFAWGILGLLFLSHFWPWMSEMIERIPNKIGKPLTILIMVFLAIDLALSGLAVYRQKERLDNKLPLFPIEYVLDEWYPDAYMKKKYPSMSFKNDTLTQEENTQEEQDANSEAA